jgi:hypothetical protein
MQEPQAAPKPAPKTGAAPAAPVLAPVPTQKPLPTFAAAAASGKPAPSMPVPVAMPPQQQQVRHQPGGGRGSGPRAAVSHHHHQQQQQAGGPPIGPIPGMYQQQQMQQFQTMLPPNAYSAAAGQQTGPYIQTMGGWGPQGTPQYFHPTQYSPQQYPGAYMQQAAAAAAAAAAAGITPGMPTPAAPAAGGAPGAYQQGLPQAAPQPPSKAPAVVLPAPRQRKVLKIVNPDTNEELDVSKFPGTQAKVAPKPEDAGNAVAAPTAPGGKAPEAEAPEKAAEPAKVEPAKAEPAKVQTVPSAWSSRSFKDVALVDPKIKAAEDAKKKVSCIDRYMA